MVSPCYFCEGIKENGLVNVEGDFVYLCEDCDIDGDKYNGWNDNETRVSYICCECNKVFCYVDSDWYIYHTMCFDCYDENIPPCPHGNSCYRKCKTHFEEYKHK